MKSCTIIIPIYNAYEVTKQAIAAVIKNTDLENNKLVLIDDCSTDERISKLLKEYQNYENIIVKHNVQNMGFVKTVNIGMHLDKNDVLLLNSDTEVTADWLTKIKKCAYMDDNIATVTPLSNNATLVSVPRQFAKNDLPKNLSVEEMGRIVADCSFRDYPQIPTGHGFCLFIKRDVLEEVGYFDEDAFGKGYGEENDFCYRCLNYGYRHVVCDDVYVYHKESQSFSQKKLDLLASSGKILKERYPLYVKRLEIWCQKNPLQYLGDNITLNLAHRKEKINILYIIHDWDLKHLGGTTFHAKDLIDSLKEQFNFYVLTLEGDFYKLYCYFEDGEVVLNLGIIEDIHVLKFYDSAYEKMVTDIINNFKISIIHIHHLKGHYFNIKNIISKYKIYTIFTLHDYYSICPQINKLYQNQYYCGKNPSTDLCAQCLKSIYNNNLSIRTWRKEYYDLLKKVDLLIAPNITVQEELKVFYPDLEVKVIEHGINIPKRISTLNLQDTPYFDIAFIGAIGVHKGSKIFKELINNKKLKKVRIHLFGYIDAEVNNKKFINHGPYKREELPDLLAKNNIKLICLLSTWPETFSYTLSEAVASGIPVLAYDVGAIANRIKENNLGWLINLNDDINIIVSKINEIFANKKEYDKVISSLNKYSLKSVLEMAKEYQVLYQKGKPEKFALERVQEKIKNNIKYEINIEDNSAWVFSTLKWKIISKIKIPKSLKKAGKKIKNIVSKKEV